MRISRFATIVSYGLVILDIITTINAFNQRFGEEVILRMVTLQELYLLIREKVTDAPVYRGSMNDWWGNGVGSTPYAVKHYKEGLRLAALLVPHR